MGRRDDDWATEMSNATWGIIFWIIGAIGFGIMWLFRQQQTRAEGEIEPTAKPTPKGEAQLPWVTLLGITCLLGAGWLASDRGNAPILIFSLGIGGVGCLIFGITQPRPVVTVEAPPEPASPIIYTITISRGGKWQGQQALHFLNQLLQNLPSLTFQITADHTQINWRIVDVASEILPDIIEGLVRASYPDADITFEITLPAPSILPLVRYTTYYRQANMFVAPLQYVGDTAQFDPLQPLTQAMNDLKAGERVTYTVALNGISKAAYRKGEELITTSTINPAQLFTNRGLGEAFGQFLTGTDRVEKYVPQDQRMLEDKLKQRLYACTVLMQVDAENEIRLLELLVRLDAQLSNFTRQPYNGLVWVERKPEAYTLQVNTPEAAAHNDSLSIVQRWMQGIGGDRPPTLILEPRELALLWHLPHEGCTASRIEWAQKRVQVSETLRNVTDGLVLGSGVSSAGEIVVRQSASDRLTHLNLIGKTGTGKSTLLHHLIHQDIAHGRGVAVIDPHGQLIQAILRCSIPMSREQDVVLLDFANSAYPPPLNPLSDANQYARTLRVVGIIERLFEGTEGAARMSSYLRAGLLTLQAQTQATLRDLARVFTDDVYRESLLNRLDDPETQDFWDFQYSGASLALQRQIADPILNRLRPFYANPHLYPILCHPDTLDLSSLMRSKKIVLISLQIDEDLVPKQERDLVGSLLVSRLQMSGMQALNTQPFGLYIDEVQRFVTTSLSDMYSEARKYGLALTTANQYLGQLTGKTLEAVMGNVGATVIFSCSPDDAQALAAYTKPEFSAHDLLNLDRFEAVVKMQVHGQTQPAFSLTAIPPLEEAEAAELREQSLRREAIRRYTPKSREDVLAWLKDRYPRRNLNQTPTSDEATFYDQA